MFFFRLRVGSGGAGAALAPRADLEITDERAVIGEAHVRDPKIGDLDVGAHQNEVQLDRGTRAGKEGRPRVLALRSPAARMNR